MVKVRPAGKTNILPHQMRCENCRTLLAEIEKLNCHQTNVCAAAKKE
jgi:hypothetical protein